MSSGKIFAYWLINVLIHIDLFVHTVRELSWNTMLPLRFSPRIYWQISLMIGITVSTLIQRTCCLTLSMMSTQFATCKLRWPHGKRSFCSIRITICCQYHDVYIKLSGGNVCVLSKGEDTSSCIVDCFKSWCRLLLDGTHMLTALLAPPLCFSSFRPLI